jgi:hypothetical protein
VVLLPTGRVFLDEPLYVAHRKSPHHSTCIEKIGLLKRILGERASALSLVQELLHRKK